MQADVASHPPPRQAATAGAGPLLQRDYWAVIKDPTCSPSAIAALIVRKFPEFAPAHLAAFTAPNGDDVDLELGDVLDIHIALAGDCKVEVLHRNPQSVTLGTCAGHPEAGRITFGAYKNALGDVLFHIRSIARSSTAANYVGFLGIGEAMQTETWAAFINNVATTVGRGVAGAIQVSTETLTEEAENTEAEARCLPTYLAQGD